jgi:primosomal protein N'
LGSSTVTVLLDRPGRARSFSYGWPTSLGAPRVGDEVIVDLRGRRVAGWVVACDDGYEGTTKPVLRRRRPAPPAAVVATALAAGRWYLASAAPFLRRARSPRVQDALLGADEPDLDQPEAPATPELAWQPFGQSPAEEVARLVEERDWSRVLVACPTERQAARVRAALASRGHLVREVEHDWRQLARGDAGLVVGTRSVALAPLREVEGVLVVDAIDPLHREEAFPHADTSTLAGIRAAAEGVPLVLVGAVPPLEACHPDARPAKGPWPLVELAARRGHTPGETALEQVLRQLPEGSSAAIVLARSGATEGLRCRDCRARPSCPRCHARLRVARWPGPQPTTLLARLRAGMMVLAMACESCGAQYPLACDRCGSTRLAPVGVSTVRAAALAEGILRRPVAVVEEKGPLPPAPYLVGGVGLLDRLTRVDVAILEGLDDLFGVRDLLGAPRMLYYLHRAALVADRVVAVLGGEEPALAEALAARDLSRFYESELATRARLGLPPAIVMALIEGALPVGARERLARDCELVALSPERLLVTNPSELALHRALEQALCGAEPTLRVELSPRSLGVL